MFRGLVMSKLTIVNKTILMQIENELFKVFRSNCSRNENVLKLPRHQWSLYDILNVHMT